MMVTNEQDRDQILADIECVLWEAWEHGLTGLNYQRLEDALTQRYGYEPSVVSKAVTLLLAVGIVEQVGHDTRDKRRVALIRRCKLGQAWNEVREASLKRGVSIWGICERIVEGSGLANSLAAHDCLASFAQDGDRSLVEGPANA